MVRKVPNDNFLLDRTRLFFEMKQIKKGRFVKGNPRIFDDFSMLVNGFWLLLFSTITAFGFIWMPVAFIMLAPVTEKYFLLNGIAMIAIDPMFGLPDFRSRIIPIIFLALWAVCFFLDYPWLSLFPLAIAISSGVREIMDIIQLRMLVKLASTEHIYFHLMFKAGAINFKDKVGDTFQMQEPVFDVLSGRSPNAYMKNGIKAHIMNLPEEIFEATEEISETSKKHAQADKDLRDAIATLKRVLKKGM